MKRYCYNFTPFDLHVLNTPPAFVLSQNQTLRKKYFLLCINTAKLTCRTSNPLRNCHPAPRTNSWRAAHNLAFILLRSAASGIRRQQVSLMEFPTHFGTVRAEPHCQRSGSRGLKSRSGLGVTTATTTDCRSLASPASWRQAQAIPPLSHGSIHFVRFF